MMFSSDKPGRIIGSTLVLQVMLAQMIARQADADELFAKFEGFARGLEPSIGGSGERFEFLADLSAGAQDTIDHMRHLVVLARNAPQ